MHNSNEFKFNYFHDFFATNHPETRHYCKALKSNCDIIRAICHATAR